MDKIINDRKQIRSIILCFALSLIFLVNPVYAEGSLRIEKIRSDINSPQLKFHVVYPHISGLTDENMQHRLNVAFMEKAEAARIRAEYEAKSATVDGGVDFEVKRNNDGVLSLVMKENTNMINGNRTDQTGVTINTVTGQRYLISDLFTQNADYVATLSAQIKTQIQHEKLDSYQVRDFVNISENEDYYLNGESLVIFFKQGEYFRTSCGVKEFAIPLKSLDGILKTQFI